MSCPAPWTDGPGLGGPTEGRELVSRTDSLHGKGLNQHLIILFASSTSKGWGRRPPPPCRSEQGRSVPSTWPRLSIQDLSLAVN